MDNFNISFDPEICDSAILSVYGKLKIEIGKFTIEHSGCLYNFLYNLAASWSNITNDCEEVRFRNDGSMVMSYIKFMNILDSDQDVSEKEEIEFHKFYDTHDLFQHLPGIDSMLCIKRHSNRVMKIEYYKPNVEVLFFETNYYKTIGKLRLFIEFMLDKYLSGCENSDELKKAWSNRIEYAQGIPTKIEGDYYVPVKSSKEYKEYKKHADNQLNEWVNGNPIHNNWHKNKDYGECCPDFSCCNGNWLWPEEQRIRFVNASEEERNIMLSKSLGNAISSHNSDQKFYIAGDTHG
jgi:hypothetical protein